MVELITRRSLVLLLIAVPVAALTGLGVVGKQLPDLLASSGPMVASLAAAIVCWSSARRTVGVEHAWRMAMAIGMLGWFAGSAYSVIQTFVLQVASHSPSPADIGFFSLPIAGLFALSCFARGPHGERRHVPVVLVLDCLAVIAAMLLVTWLTGMDQVFWINAGWNLGYALQIAYFGLNFALLAFIPILWLARRVSDWLRVQLALLGLGLLIMAVSNCLFIYLVATRSPEADLSRFGYIVGPVAIMMAAFTNPVTAKPSRATAVLLHRALVSLPYFVVALAGSAVAFSFIVRHALDSIALALGWFISIIVLARQVFILREDSERLNDLAAAQSQLVYMAEHDPLTGIANRSHFDHHLAHALSANKNESEPLAILFIDVDNFKSINDRHGHVAGDELLALLAERLQRCVRDDDVVARIGGDEFALLLRRAALPASVSERVLDALQQPYRLRVGWVVAHVSVGLISLRGGEGDLLAEDLMDCVDAAMYEAKKQHGSALVMFDADRLTARTVCEVALSTCETRNPRNTSEISLR